MDPFSANTNTSACTTVADAVVSVMQEATLNAKVRAACSDWAVDHRYECNNQPTNQPTTTPKPNQTKPTQPNPTNHDDDDDDDDHDGNNKVTKKYQTNDHHSQPQPHLATVAFFLPPIRKVKIGIISFSLFLVGNDKMSFPILKKK